LGLPSPDQMADVEPAALEATLERRHRRVGESSAPWRVLVLELALDELAEHVEGQDLALLLKQWIAIEEGAVVIRIVVRLAHEVRFDARDEVGDLRALVLGLGEEKTQEPAAHE